MSVASVSGLGPRTASAPVVRSDAVVLFGITGDLAFKKLFPALYNLARSDRLNLPVIGVGRSTWDDERLMQRARESVQAQLGSVDEGAFESLARSLSYLNGDYNDADTFMRIRERLGSA